MNTAECHTIEHLGATFLRNHAEWSGRIVYFGHGEVLVQVVTAFLGSGTGDIAGVEPVSRAAFWH